MPTAVVELLDINGEWWNLTEGDRGVYLATGVTGIHDPPVKVVYEEPGNYPGARYLNDRVLRRDIVFGVEILNDRDESWESRDSAWRKAWSFKEDCFLYVTTEESGTRYLKLRLGESISVETRVDPHSKNMNTAAMVCIAGDPFWYEPDVVYSAVTVTDTTFDPTPLPWPWPQEAIPTETITITVEPDSVMANGDTNRYGLNPTDQSVYLKWTVPGSTEAPSAPYIPFIPWLGAPDSPACIWTIPDYDYEDATMSNRRLRLPGLIGGLRTNCVQKVWITGAPTGGSFQLSFDGQGPTANIARNATAATVKTALVALSNIDTADLNVTGGPTFLAPWQPYLIEFKGQYEGEEVPVLTVTNTLTGGTTPWAYAQITTPGVTAPAENCVVDTDPRVEQVVSESESPVWQRMNGVRFRNPIPPYTQARDFELTVSGCIPGQMVTLRIPRPWSRPWGLQ